MPLTRDDMLELVENAKAPALTLAFQTFRSPPDVQQNPVRYKNLMRKAEAEIGKKTPREFDEAFEEAWSLVESPNAWEKPLDGIALFVCPELMRFEKLNFVPPETVEVKETFAIMPFINLFAHREKFLVLAAAYSEVRLFESDGESLTPISEEGLQETLDDMIAKTQVHNKVNFHTASAPKTGSEQAANFHALGESHVDVVEDLRKEFAARVARVADQIGAKRNHPPMVVIADDRLLGEINANAETQLVTTLETRISPAGMEESELLSLAKKVMEPHRQAYLQSRLDEFRANHGDPDSNKASANPSKLALAAVQGRIATLFVSRNGELRGRVDPNDGTIREAGRKGDLIDDLARLTLFAQGEVFAVPPGTLPKDASVAALFRW